MATDSGLLVPVDYGGSDDDDEQCEEILAESPFSIASTSSGLVPPVNMIPAVVTKFDVGGMSAVAVTNKQELQFNPKYEDLYAPEVPIWDVLIR